MKYQKKFDLNYLKKYWEFETESLQKFVDTNKLKNVIRLQYPQKNRFVKLSNTYSYAVIGDGIKILPQIPCTGSLIIPLTPCSNENQFKKNYGFDSRDISDLIKYSKTGRIQFIIEGQYQQFENLGFLKPIFEELQPPVYYSPIALLYPDKMKEFCEEIRTNVDHRFFNFKQCISLFINSNDPYVIQSIYHNFIIHYAYMRLFGYDRLADEVLLNTQTINSNQIFTALSLDRMFDEFILPSISPFHARMSVNIESLKNARKFLPKNMIMKSNTQMCPFEIGSFLLENLVYTPNNFQELDKIMRLYKQNEYLKVYHSLEKAITDNAISNIQCETEELKQILQNIWNDSDKVGIGRKKIRAGLLLSLGVVGSCLQNYPGLISSVGTIGTTFLASYCDDIAPIFSNAYHKPLLVNIYDFKNRS